MSFDAMLEREVALLEGTRQLTFSQIREAVLLLEEAMPDDRRAREAPMLAATLQALATNFQSLVLARRNFTIE